jgi:hypothetical protein
MKDLLRFALVALSVCASPLAWTAEKKPETPGSVRPAAKPSIAGHYSGKWQSTADAAGDVRITLKQDGATWVAEVTFTFEGAEIPTKMKTVEVDGAKIQLVYDWAIQGTTGQSKLSGELTGDTLHGKFEGKSSEGTTTGTWTVKRK